jgi:hypothetical protein
MTELNQQTLKLAAEDFLYLMDRGYPRSASLQLVGNRHNLDAVEREILHRGVFARGEAKKRRIRLIGAEELVSRRLLVDGHNVVITTESGLTGLPLIAANDGVIRDVAGVSHRYRISSDTHEAIEGCLKILHDHPPDEIFFYLDAPIRQSGELAALLRSALKSRNLAGGAQAVKVPEEHLIGTQDVVASSDSAVLDRVKYGFDLAGAVIKSLPQEVTLIDFTFLG